MYTSAGLFQRAVLMGGSALSPWALTRQAEEFKAQVARRMDCNVDENQSADADIGECLRNKDLSELLQIEAEGSCMFCASFAPFVDGAVIQAEPLVAMQSSSDTFGRFQLLAGVTSSESYRHIRYVSSPSSSSLFFCNWFQYSIIIIKKSHVWKRWN